MKTLICNVENLVGEVIAEKFNFATNMLNKKVFWLAKMFLIDIRNWRMKFKYYKCL